MSSSPALPTLGDLLDALLPDPAPRWPSVPAAPVDPGPGWTARRTDGTHHPVWTAPVAPGEAARRWLEHRAAYERTGLWPLLVTEPFWEAVELEPHDVPGAPPVADTPGLLRHLIGAYADEELDVSRGPVPAPVADDRTDEQVVGGAAEGTTLVLVPTRAPWLVPELLGWDGSVNHDVMGREHTAVLGRWAGLYGAELYALERDVVCLLVSRPPGNDRARLLAAAEVYAYCPDAVDQGVETLEALTAMTGSRGWWLWWD